MIKPVFKKDFEKIARIIANQHERVFAKKMLLKKYNELVAKLSTIFEDGRLIYQKLPNGEIGFFFTFESAVMQEFNERFFRVQYCYCVNDSTVRAIFYRLLKKTSLSYKKKEKIKRMVIQVFAEDTVLKRYFLKKGKLTYIELIGNTQFGLGILKKEKRNLSHLKIKKAVPQDFMKLVSLDMASHLADKSSRMHEIFSKPQGQKAMRGFYTHVLKNKSCFVVKDLKNKNKIAGSISYFINKKDNLGLIASIFVANQYKGKGISYLLYQRLLEEFARNKLRHYLGASTTERVLSLSSKIGRKELSSSIIVPLF